MSPLGVFDAPFMPIQRGSSLPSWSLSWKTHAAPSWMLANPRIRSAMYSCFRIDYSKLPPIPPVEKVFILDPLIATGNTACAALTMIIEWGVPGNGSCYTSASWTTVWSVFSEPDQVARCNCVKTGIGAYKGWIPRAWGKEMVTLKFDVLMMRHFRSGSLPLTRTSRKKELSIQDLEIQ